jgi:hypothetical protein
MENPDLKQAFQDVRDALHQRFASTNLDDTDGMSNIRKLLHLLESLEANLYRAIEDGHLEDFNVNQMGKGNLRELYNGRSTSTAK